MTKKINMRIIDILGHPDLEKSSGWNLARYRTLVQQSGEAIARGTKVPVEVA